MRRIARRLFVLSCLVVLPILPGLSNRTANAAAYISLVGYTLVNQGDVQFQTVPDGVNVGNYSFPDGHSTANIGILLDGFVATVGEVTCNAYSQARTCNSGPNFSDLTWCPDAQKGSPLPNSCSPQLGLDRTCATAAAVPVPCYDIPYAGSVYSSVINSAQIGGSWTADGGPASHSHLRPTTPDTGGHTLHLTVSNLPAGVSEMVLYLAGEPGVKKPITNGCFTVSSGGASVEQYGFVNADGQGRNTGELIQWEISGFSSVDIYESESNCGNTTVPSTDGTLDVSGLFFELPPPPATPTPTSTPTATATPLPTAAVEPSSTSTPIPSSTSTPAPTATWTPVPTDTSTAVPTMTVTAVPTNTLTGVPTAASTAVPTMTASALSTDTSTATLGPASSPTATPTLVPPPDTPAIQLQHVKIAAGSKLKGTVLTSPGADITAQLEVKQHKELVYEATKHGIADGNGSYALSMRIRFHPSKRTKGVLIITADSPGGTAINSVSVTILPHA
jgi:hypothetical protein